MEDARREEGGGRSAHPPNTSHTLQQNHRWDPSIAPPFLLSPSNLCPLAPDPTASSLTNVIGAPICLSPSPNNTHTGRRSARVVCVRVCFDPMLHHIEQQAARGGPHLPQRTRMSGVLTSRPAPRAPGGRRSGGGGDQWTPSTSTRTRALPELLDAASALAPHLPLAYEPVAAPCSLMNCGDAIYRSTLDPALRKEVAGPSWQLFALIGAAAFYLFATPGVLPGAYDYYVASRLQQKRQRPVDKADLTLGRKLGSGAFGSAFKATLAPEAPGGAPAAVIVKKAKEFGEAEAWMNERISRCAPEAAAGFIAAFQDDSRPERPPSAGGGAAGGALRGLFGKKKADGGGAAGANNGSGGDAGPNVWLVFRDEGDYGTLWDLMQSVREGESGRGGERGEGRGREGKEDEGEREKKMRVLVAGGTGACCRRRSPQPHIPELNQQQPLDQQQPPNQPQPSTCRPIDPLTCESRRASQGSPTTWSASSSAASSASTRASSAASPPSSSPCASSSRPSAPATPTASCTATSSRRTRSRRPATAGSS